MKSNRIISSILAASMLLSLSACGKKDEKKEEKTNKKGEITPSPKKEKERLQVEPLKDALAFMRDIITVSFPRVNQQIARLHTVEIGNRSLL